MTPDELRQQELSHERHIADLLEVRNRGKRSRWWDHAGLTALLGSVSAALITFGGSYFLKTQEFVSQQRAAQRTQTRLAILEANSMIAGMLKANEERFLLARGKMAKLAPEQRQEISRGTNRIQQEWRLQRENAEMNVRLSFASVPTVPKEWATARSRLETYTDCIEAAYIKFQADTAPADVCQGERARSLGSMEQLRNALVRAYSRELQP